MKKYLFILSFLFFAFCSSASAKTVSQTTKDCTNGSRGFQYLGLIYNGYWNYPAGYSGNFTSLTLYPAKTQSVRIYLYVNGNKGAYWDRTIATNTPITLSSGATIIGGWDGTFKATDFISFGTSDTNSNLWYGSCSNSYKDLTYNTYGYQSLVTQLPARDSGVYDLAFDLAIQEPSGLTLISPTPNQLNVYLGTTIVHIKATTTNSTSFYVTYKPTGSTQPDRFMYQVPLEVSTSSQLIEFDAEFPVGTWDVFFTSIGVSQNYYVSSTIDVYVENRNPYQNASTSSLPTFASGTTIFSQGINPSALFTDPQTFYKDNLPSVFWVGSTAPSSSAIYTTITSFGKTVLSPVINILNNFYSFFDYQKAVDLASLHAQSLKSVISSILELDKIFPLPIISILLIVLLLNLAVMVFKLVLYFKSLVRP